MLDVKEKWTPFQVDGFIHQHSMDAIKDICNAHNSLVSDYELLLNKVSQLESQVAMGRVSDNENG